MVRRKGMGKGKGKGYKNIIGKDPKVHSDSAKGRKQPQKLPVFIETYPNKEKEFPEFPQIHISPVGANKYVSTLKVDELYGQKSYPIKVDYAKTILFKKKIFYVGKMQNGKMVLFEM